MTMRKDFHGLGVRVACRLCGGKFAARVRRASVCLTCDISGACRLRVDGGTHRVVSGSAGLADRGMAQAQAAGWVWPWHGARARQRLPVTLVRQSGRRWLRAARQTGAHGHGGRLGLPCGSGSDTSAGLRRARRAVPPMRPDPARSGPSGPRGRGLSRAHARHWPVRGARLRARVSPSCRDQPPPAPQPSPLVSPLAGWSNVNASAPTFSAHSPYPITMSPEK